MMRQRSQHTLILFDIDGTMILTGGRAGKLMVRAVEEIIGKPVPYRLNIFIGSTDRRIIRTFLEEAGIAPVETDGLIDKILERYLNYLEEQISQPGVIQVLPGVQELLTMLSRDSRFALGLLTGNVQAGARAKLHPVGLYQYFPIGAFGDDAIDRDRLPPIALRRASAYYQRSFDPHNCWIIGDSPRDVQCAHMNGMRCLAVATGRPAMEELLSMHPDAVLPDLSETKKVLEILKN